MADNLTVSIGIDTKKLRADLELLKAEFRKTGADLKKAADEAMATGDKSRVTSLAAGYDVLQREIIKTSRAIQEQNRALAGHGIAAVGAARGMHALASAHGEVEEFSSRSTREIIKVSKELGTLETSGFAVAKVFKEFPKVAVPLAVAAGAAAAVAKLSNDAYKAVTSLDDLSKASGFTGEQIVALEKVFAGADVGAASLDKMLRSIGESFDKAKVKSMDFGSALSGVQTLRGGAGTAGTGIQVLRGGAGPLPSGIEGQGRVVVFRGDQPFNIDPSKGFAGLVDPNQFRTQLDWLAAVRQPLLNINRTAPSLGREIIRGQGFDVGETLRALAANTAEEFAKAMQEQLRDPRTRPGVLPFARQFGAQQEETGAAGERSRTEAGISAMEAALPGLKRAQEGFEALAEQIRKTREGADEFNNALTKGVDSGELGASTAAFSSAWTSAFSTIADSWKSTVDYINALRPSASGSQEGQVIPLAKAGGGLIPGRGSGDTVPAMLTPGEYVARRASVGYYGTGLFSALNNMAIPRDMFSRIGYATGGLVGDISSFAAGGEGVSARGGTGVTIVLDGQHYAARADDAVANSLVVAARRQQMRSAGVKPSWYGGRPGA